LVNTNTATRGYIKQHYWHLKINRHIWQLSRLLGADFRWSLILTVALSLGRYVCWWTISPPSVYSADQSVLQHRYGLKYIYLYIGLKFTVPNNVIFGQFPPGMHINKQSWFYWSIKKTINYHSTVKPWYTILQLPVCETLFIQLMQFNNNVDI
jgi:hypothetical protein